MNSHTRREIAELLSPGCDVYSSRSPILKLRIALPGLDQKFTVSEPSSGKPKQNAAAVWVIMLLLIAVTGSFWATNQLCGVLAQRMQEMQRQRYRQQVAFSDLWQKSRH